MTGKKLGILFIIGAVIVCALISAGCTSIPATPTGDWELPGTGITLSFSTDGTFTGKAPVNTFFGTYSLYKNTIALSIEGVTEMAGSPDEMNKEKEFFQKLGETTAFSTPDSKLQLYDNHGKTIFTFERIQKSIVGSWITEDGITLTFNADGTFSGKAPVNSYGGNYLVNGPSILLGAVSSTLMAGSEEDMNRESGYYQKLEKVSGYILNGGLLLTDKEGNILLSYRKN